jgi:uncharacterized protein
MPQGKPAGQRCLQLDDALRCRLFGRPERPQVCRSLQAAPAMCGTGRQQALQILDAWERLTRPSAGPG